MSSMKILSARIKELRKEKEKTQKEVANALGISQSTYCDYENNNIEPTASILLKIADYFGVSSDYLLGRQDD